MSRLRSATTEEVRHITWLAIVKIYIAAGMPTQTMYKDGVITQAIQGQLRKSQQCIKLTMLERILKHAGSSLSEHALVMGELGKADNICFGAPPPDYTEMPEEKLREEAMMKCIMESEKGRVTLLSLSQGNYSHKDLCSLAEITTEEIKQKMEELYSSSMV